MSDETKPNLEPVEEGDLDLKEKFLGGTKPQEIMPAKSAEGMKVEAAPYLEKVPEKAERKEGAVEKETAYNKILSKVAAHQPADDTQIAGDAENVSKEKDARSKIENLVKIAETKGIPHAVKVARHLEDNYFLDEFHDTLLADELHNALVKKGMIKEF